MTRLFAVTWLLGAAVLPVLTGLLRAPAVGADPWVGAGGVAAVPLSLLGLRLADRAASPAAA